jgi:hypothetical protein
MNTEFSRLVGTWFGRHSSDPANQTWFRILPGGLHIGFGAYTVEGKERISLMKFRLSLESPGVLRVRLRQDAEHLALYRFEGDLMLLLSKASAESGRPFFECRRVAPAELPDWFEPRFDEAMKKPWL